MFAGIIEFVWRLDFCFVVNLFVINVDVPVCSNYVFTDCAVLEAFWRQSYDVICAIFLIVQAKSREAKLNFWETTKKLNKKFMIYFILLIYKGLQFRFRSYTFLR